MADRRMFNKSIIDSDHFLDMPVTAQNLYFHLAMRADDDGFVNNPKSIMRNVRASDDDMKVLLDKKYVILFDNGIIVIRHWRLHNYIRTDRYIPTQYTEEKMQLSMTANIYEVNTEPSQQAELEPQTPVSAEYKQIVQAFNQICTSLPKVRSITENRKKQIASIVKQFPDCDFTQVFQKIERSDFLTGRNKKWTGCGFDWIFKPANFIKIVEGNYDNDAAGTDKISIKAGVTL